MTYHLASLRLRSIGERSARFNDLTINTLGPHQTPLDHVVWLRNGGGKSSLLSLFYALLLPRKYDFMGRSVQRDLTDYIDGPDTAHTVAAWYPAGDPTTLDGQPDRVLITGAVYEWEDLRRPVNASRDSDRLGKTFYAFYAIPGLLDLDTIPVTNMDGRPARRNDYVQHLRDLTAAHPKAEMVTTRFQNEWAAALSARGLDPDLFLAQKKMNHVEGGVEDMFRFASAKEFINFLLDLTVTNDTVTTIADNIAAISDKVAKKPHAVTERDFLAESAATLDRLALAHTSLLAANEAVDDASAAAGDLAAQFSATIAEAQSHIDAAKDVRGLVEDRRRSANTERDRANDLLYLYTYRAAELCVTEAEETLTTATTHAQQAGRAEKVWAAVGPLADYADTLIRRDEAARAAEAEEAELAPLRERHDQRAAQLKMRLTSLSEAAHERALAAEEAAKVANALHEARKAEALVAADAARDAAAEAAKLEGFLDALNEDLRRAVHNGLLPAVDTDPTEQQHALTEQRERLRADLDDVQERRRRHPHMQRDLSQRMNELVQQRSDASHALGAARDEHRLLTDRAAALSRNQRVQDLLESSHDTPVNLWADSDTLTRRLADEILAAQATILREHVARADLDRTVSAVEQTALLPSTLDADRLTATLCEAGIPAETGWAHLRSLASNERLHAALAHPTLARLGAGVVVPTDQADAAKTALTVAGESTTALVGIYTTADLETALTAPPTSTPEPSWARLPQGLVDPHAAEETAAATGQRVREHDESITRHRDASDRDRALLDTLTGFLDDCPAGHLDALAAQIETMEDTLTGLEASSTQTKADLDALADAIAADQTAAEALTADITKIDRDHSALGDLAMKVSKRADWQNARDDAARRHQESTGLATRLAREAEEALATAHRHNSQVVQHHQSASTHRTAETKIHFLGSAPVNVPASDADLSTLEQMVIDAQQAYAVPASRSVYAERVSLLSQELTKRAQQLPTDATIRAEAEALLQTPEGQSADNRQAGFTAAATERGKADQRVGEARSRVDAAKRVLEETRGLRVDMPRRPLLVEPNDATQAEELAAEQQTITSRLREDLNNIDTELTKIDTRVGSLTRVVELFGIHASDLPDADGMASAAFPSDTEAADARKKEVIATLREAEARQQAQREALGSILKDLSKTVGRYPTITTKARERLMYDDTTLPEHAATLATQFRIRIDQLDGQMAEIAKDQAIVSGQLATIVREHLDMIRRAERYSQLPETLGALGKKKLLTITFDKPADADLHAYVGRVVEKQIIQGVKPEGMDLLKAAIHESVGHRGFKVKVLKPADNIATTTEDISALAKWSGGEKLTVCVALYCTIAKLRAVNTGRKEKSGGMLVLDNPIGRASHGPLIQLQRKVAAAQGVQLLYATGVKDFDAVSLFPGVTRLDNRAGRTNSRRYIIEAPTDGVQGTRVTHLDRLASHEPA